MDWNVMSQMKNGNHVELLRILSNENKFLKMFSTAHIGDIYAGYTGEEKQKEHIDADLEFISKLTHDYCAYTNNDKVTVEPYDPKELFEQRKVPITPFADINFADLTSNLTNSSELGTELKEKREKLLNIPLDDVLKKAYNNPDGATRMQKLYPELESNQTFGGMLNAIMGQFHRLNESDDYKDMRQMVQNSLDINRDRLFDATDPIGKIEKIYEQLGRSPYLKKFEYVPDWYGDILNWYLLLDMHGYQEDKVNVTKGRKETFKNTTNDAFHAAFASICDFYITNDEKSYKKTRAVYNKLGLNTIVLKPSEFVEYYNENLAIETVQQHLLTFLYLLRSPDFQFIEDEHSTLQSFYFRDFVLDYFTRAHISFDKSSGNSLTFLSKDKPTNGRWTFAIEVETLIDKLISFFGDDLDNYGPFQRDEDLGSNWIGRRWKLENTIFRLAMPNGWLQLYMDSIYDENETIAVHE